ncbi:MAG: DMT family transporter, partial [Pseudomonadota bacterium]
MRHHPVQAATSMVGAMAIIGLIDNYIALIARDISLWQFQFLRGTIAVPTLLVLAAAGVFIVRPKRLWAVLVRNGLIAVGMLFYFGALAFMPIAQALAGLFVAPIFVLLISIFVFGERVGLLRITAVIAGFIGVLIVLQPEQGSFSLISLMPMMGGLFYAMGSVATQRLCPEEATPAMLLGLFSLQATFGATVLVALHVINPVAAPGTDGFLLRQWTTPQSFTWLLIVVQAFGSLMGVGLLIRAYQSAEPSFAAVFEY